MTNERIFVLVPTLLPSTLPSFRHPLHASEYNDQSKRNLLLIMTQSRHAGGQDEGRPREGKKEKMRQMTVDATDPSDQVDVSTPCFVTLPSCLATCRH